jgi:lipoate-protein ligase B
MPTLLHTIDLGRMAYADALAQQRAYHERVLAGEADQALMLVEHEPVITVSQRRDASRHLLADTARLTQLGIAVEPTDRGGDVTYHGPGQLVAYPIIRLADLHFNVGRYIRFLEAIIIDTGAAFGITARRVDKCTGVWVRMNGQPGQSSSEACATNEGMAKLAAIGVRVRRNVSLHGLAINVTTNLDHFATIVPCGLANRRVTSLKQLLRRDCPTMAQVKATLTHQMQHHYSAALAVSSAHGR